MMRQNTIPETALPSPHSSAPVFPWATQSMLTIPMIRPPTNTDASSVYKQTDACVCTYRKHKSNTPNASPMTLISHFARFSADRGRAPTLRAAQAGAGQLNWPTTFLWSHEKASAPMAADSGSATSNGSTCDVPKSNRGLHCVAISAAAGAAHIPTVGAGTVRSTRPNSIQAHHSPLRLVLNSPAVRGFVG